MGASIKILSSSINTVKGIEDLKNISKASVRLSMYVFGDNIKREAKRLILEPPKTGRIYRLELKGVKVYHQASAPGEPPANFTGDLRNTIDYRVKGSDQLIIKAGSQNKVFYAGDLEFGSEDGRILPRPYLNPAILKSQRDFNTIVTNYIVKRIKGSTA